MLRNDSEKLLSVALAAWMFAGERRNAVRPLFSKRKTKEFSR
jgi:hypothetical protein